MDQNYTADSENPDQAASEMPAQAVPDADARQWAMFCHLAALAQFVLPSFGNVIGPLVIWLVKKDQHPFIDDQGKEALNFQISMSLYMWLLPAISGMLICVGIGIVLFPLAIVVVLALTLADVVLAIIAGIKASNGEAYRYPITIRFLR
jgi:uncharacterized Tic20 family protein